jgi:outer membrane receptor for ferrienterochelin and colicin
VIQKLIYKSLILLLFWSVCLDQLQAQSALIQGIVTDAKTHETIVGANVVLQGTTIGASTDLDGKYKVENVAAGTYNLVVSFISYKTKVIENVKVTKGNATNLNIEIEENVASLQGVVITATKRTGTEVSLLTSIKKADVAITGVSRESITRTQDRDASEVVKRIPGITIMDDRFVMVRGLSQRYNTVWLNNAATPSSEADVRAFSFDVIPSSLLENILVFKTPAPELPADFSGAAIKISTRSLNDDNSVSVGYSASYRSGSTFEDYKLYKPSKYTWLGMNDGTLNLPEGFPSHLNKVEDADELTAIGRSFNTIWSPELTTALPDQRFIVSLNQRFRAGKVSIGNISSVNYSYTSDIDQITRSEFQAYNELKDKPDTSYTFRDERYKTGVRIGLLHNWVLNFGNNQKIEFRNLFNHFGTSTYTDRNGRDNYGGLTIQARELKFQTRNTYSGQLGGTHDFNNQRTKLDWTLGFSYADRDEPDTKRLSSTLNEEDPDNPHYGEYGVNFSFAATPELSGRVYQNMTENIAIAGTNIEHQLVIGEFTTTLKAGLYAEQKRRNFNARNIGYIIANIMQFDWELPYQPIDSIFNNSNINNTTGIKIDETTNNSDSYEAGNDLLAAYIAAKLPFTKKLNLYTGIRFEQNKQTLDSYSSDNGSVPVNVKIDEARVFPSANFTYNFTEKSLLRASWGMTVNRPEFREIAPFAFYDFELKKVIRGNPELKNTLIHNADLRFEVYPSPNENLTFGVFYKKFNSPVETIEVNSGSGKDYTFENAKGAYSAGMEIEVKKSFASLAEKSNAMAWLKNFSVVLNASIIKSEIEIDTALHYARNATRSMMGQSPYIVNAGIYYANQTNGLSISALYNIIGKRIVVVGLDAPDIYEMPRHQIDLSIQKSFGTHLNVKLGVQDLLNQSIVEKQFVDFTKDGTDFQREQITYSLSPGAYYTLGLTYTF